MLEIKEYTVLNKPGFKVIRGSGNSWVRIHNGKIATTPYVNPHRWWLGIKEYEVAEYISLKSKIDYWTPQKWNTYFNGEKYTQYNQTLVELLEKYDESKIINDIIKYEWSDEFLPQAALDMFVF